MRRNTFAGGAAETCLASPVRTAAALLLQDNFVIELEGKGSGPSSRALWLSFWAEARTRVQI